jgi:hypothetical protein
LGFLVLAARRAIRAILVMVRVGLLFLALRATRVTRVILVFRAVTAPTALQAGMALTAAMALQAGMVSMALPVRRAIPARRRGLLSLTGLRVCRVGSRCWTLPVWFLPGICRML